MKKILKIAGFILLAIVFVLLIVIIVFEVRWDMQSQANMDLLGQEAPDRDVGGFRFRDLNKNGELDTYEDSRAPLEQRVEDLLSKMTLEEKAGTMFITMIGMNEEGKILDKPLLSNPLTFILKPTSEMIAKLKMNSFNIIQSYPADQMARWSNTIQKLGERTRLGIPITIASDPRNGIENNPGANLRANQFSHWPSALGLAATRDTVLVRKFADIARQEYMAVGIRLALHPMADLATEPRWGRINGTFGEDANVSAAMTKAYVLGFQGDSLGTFSVACMSKHFSGGGPQKDGEDAHFPYGKEQVYPGHNFDYHLIPFEKGAFAAHTAQIMPYYGIPMDVTSENVGFSFNKDIITGLLRNKYNFQGVICTDWNIITQGGLGEPKAWGVETLTPIARVKKALDAGVDQFGGETAVDLIIELVKSGQISESRIDKSVQRILKDKFRLGLFDNPYLDEQKALDIVGNKSFVDAGKEAQRRAITLLKNASYQGHPALPLHRKIKVYLKNIDDTLLDRYSQVVGKPDDADFILIKLTTPFTPRDNFFLERFFHQGRLNFDKKEKDEILSLMDKKPTIVLIDLERPAVIPDITKAATGVLVGFGCEDDALIDALFGLFSPSGKLPFEMPSSMEAVEKQFEDVPYDSEKPLFPFGFGLTYSNLSISD